MQRNLDEIISYMQDKFRPYDLFDRQLKQITRDLMERGYTLDEITRGINAYLLQLKPGSSDLRYRERTLQRERTFRILDSSESRYISRDAYGYLCLLRGLGLISTEETEELINYVVENQIEVQDGEELQSVMMDLVSENEMEGEINLDNKKELEDRPVLWHNFRKRRLH